MANKQPITQIDINNLDALLREGKVDEFYDVLYKADWTALKPRKTLLCFVVEGDGYGSYRGRMAVIFV